MALAGLMAGLIATGNVALAAPRTAPAGSPSTPRLAVVAVAVDPGLEGPAAELSQYAEQAAVRSGRFQPVWLASSLEGEGASARNQKEAEAEAAMAEGQRVYEELDTAAALTQFEKAANLFVQTDLSRTFQRWVDAQLLRAACLVANGELKVAEVELDRVLALEPRAQLSANLFPPETLAYAEKVKRSVLSLATATLKVTTSPAGARIYLDGRFKGVSPVELTGLTQADHFVTAVMPGRTLVQRRARSGAVALELPYSTGAAQLDKAVTDTRLDSRGPGRDKALRALGQALQVDQLLALLVRRGGLSSGISVTGLRLEMTDGHNAGWGEQELALDDSLPVNAEPFLAALLGTDVPRRGGPVTHFEKKGGGGADNLLAYGLLGGGAALVAGGAVFGLLALGKSNEYRAVPQASPDAAAVASTGRTYALVADVGVIAGLVTAGVGTWLAVTGKPGPAAPPKAAAPPTPAPPSTPARKAPSAEPAAEPPPSDGPGPVPAPPTAGQPERKLTKKELEEEKRREKAEKRKAAEEAARLEREEKKRAAEEKKRAAEEEKKRAAEDKKRAAEEAARERDAQKQVEEEARRAQPAPVPPAEEPPARPSEPPERKLDERPQREDEEKKRREDEEKKRREDEEKRRREDEEKRRREDEEKKRREDEERKKREGEQKKRRTDDEDDLRNY